MSGEDTVLSPAKPCFEIPPLSSSQGRNIHIPSDVCSSKWTRNPSKHRVNSPAWHPFPFQSAKVIYMKHLGCTLCMASATGWSSFQTHHLKERALP